MPTITIYRDTFREAACVNAHDLAVFDIEADRVFREIAEEASDNGLSIEVKDGRSHGPSYTVDADSYEAEQVAHDFMQSPDANFWDHV